MQNPNAQKPWSHEKTAEQWRFSELQKSSLAGSDPSSGSRGDTRRTSRILCKRNHVLPLLLLYLLLRLLLLLLLLLPGPTEGITGPVGGGERRRGQMCINLRAGRRCQRLACRGRLAADTSRRRRPVAPHQRRWAELSSLEALLKLCEEHVHRRIEALLKSTGTGCIVAEGAGRTQRANGGQDATCRISNTGSL